MADRSNNASKSGISLLFLEGACPPLFLEGAYPGYK